MERDGFFYVPPTSQETTKPKQLKFRRKILFQCFVIPLYVIHERFNLTSYENLFCFWFRTLPYLKQNVFQF